MSGWIKLHRKIEEKAIWQDPPMLKLWLYCLIRANHTETEVLIEKQEIKLYPGQFVTGRYALAEDYNRGTKKRHRVPPNTLWRWLQKFKEWDMLDIKPTNKYSVITIKNWHAYQQNEQQMNSGFGGLQHKPQKNGRDLNNNKQDETPEMTGLPGEGEHQNEQQMGNRWATDGHQMGTDKNDKNDKEMIDDDRLI